VFNLVKVYIGIIHRDSLANVLHVRRIKMEDESPEDGLEELMRLSQQFKKQDEERIKKEQQRAEQSKKVQDVLGGLKGLNISMAVEQLKMVATPEIIEQVNSLKSKSGTQELRKLISDLTDDLEKHISIISSSNPDIKSLESSVKTLTILIELFFSLQ
jgi:hypothetical protein